MGLKSIKSARAAANEINAVAAGIAKAQQAVNKDTIRLAEQTDSRVTSRAAEQQSIQKENLAADLSNASVKAATAAFGSVLGALGTVAGALNKIAAGEQKKADVKAAVGLVKEGNTQLDTMKAAGKGNTKEYTTLKAKVDALDAKVKGSKDISNADLKGVQNATREARTADASGTLTTTSQDTQSTVAKAAGTTKETAVADLGAVKTSAENLGKQLVEQKAGLEGEKAGLNASKETLQKEAKTVDPDSVRGKEIAKEIKAIDEKIGKVDVKLGENKVETEAVETAVKNIDKVIGKGKKITDQDVKDIKGDVATIGKAADKVADAELQAKPATKQDIEKTTTKVKETAEKLGKAEGELKGLTKPAEIAAKKAEIAVLKAELSTETKKLASQIDSVAKGDGPAAVALRGQATALRDQAKALDGGDDGASAAAVKTLVGADGTGGLVKDVAASGGAVAKDAPKPPVPEGQKPATKQAIDKQTKKVDDLVKAVEKDPTNKNLKAQLAHETNKLADQLDTLAGAGPEGDGLREQATALRGQVVALGKSADPKAIATEIGKTAATAGAEGSAKAVVGPEEKAATKQEIKAQSEYVQSLAKQLADDPDNEVLRGKLTAATNKLADQVESTAVAGPAGDAVRQQATDLRGAADKSANGLTVDTKALVKLADSAGEAAIKVAVDGPELTAQQNPASALYIDPETGLDAGGRDAVNRSGKADFKDTEGDVVDQTSNWLERFLAAYNAQPRNMLERKIMEGALKIAADMASPNSPAKERLLEDYAQMKMEDLQFAMNGDQSSIFSTRKGLNRALEEKEAGEKELVRLKKDAGASENGVNDADAELTAEVIAQNPNAGKSGVDAAVSDARTTVANAARIKENGGTLDADQRTELALAERIVGKADAKEAAQDHRNDVAKKINSTTKGIEKAEDSIADEMESVGDILGDLSGVRDRLAVIYAAKDPTGKGDSYHQAEQGGGSMSVAGKIALTAMTGGLGLIALGAAEGTKAIGLGSMFEDTQVRGGEFLSKLDSSLAGGFAALDRAQNALVGQTGDFNNQGDAHKIERRAKFAERIAKVNEGIFEDQKSELKKTESDMKTILGLNPGSNPKVTLVNGKATINNLDGAQRAFAAAEKRVINSAAQWASAELDAIHLNGKGDSDLEISPLNIFKGKNPFHIETGNERLKDAIAAGRALIEHSFNNKVDAQGNAVIGDQNARGVEAEQQLAVFKHLEAGGDRDTIGSGLKEVAGRLQVDTAGGNGDARLLRRVNGHLNQAQPGIDGLNAQTSGFESAASEFTDGKFDTLKAKSGALQGLVEDFAEDSDLQSVKGVPVTAQQIRTVAKDLEAEVQRLLKGNDLSPEQRKSLQTQERILHKTIEKADDLISKQGKVEARIKELDGEGGSPEVQQKRRDGDSDLQKLLHKADGTFTTSGTSSLKSELVSLANLGSQQLNADNLGEQTGRLSSHYGILGGKRVEGSADTQDRDAVRGQLLAARAEAEQLTGHPEEKKALIKAIDEQIHKLNTFQEVDLTQVEGAVTAYAGALAAVKPDDHGPVGPKQQAANIDKAAAELLDFVKTLPADGTLSTNQLTKLLEKVNALAVQVKAAGGDPAALEAIAAKLTSGTPLSAPDLKAVLAATKGAATGAQSVDKQATALIAEIDALPADANLNPAQRTELLAKVEALAGTLKGPEAKIFQDLANQLKAATAPTAEALKLGIATVKAAAVELQSADPVVVDKKATDLLAYVASLGDISELAPAQKTELLSKIEALTGTLKGPEAKAALVELAKQIRGDAAPGVAAVTGDALKKALAGITKEAAGFTTYVDKGGNQKAAELTSTIDGLGTTANMSEGQKTELIAKIEALAGTLTGPEGAKLRELAVALGKGPLNPEELAVALKEVKNIVADVKNVSVAAKGLTTVIDGLGIVGSKLSPDQKTALLAKVNGLAAVATGPEKEKLQALAAALSGSGLTGPELKKSLLDLTEIAHKLDLTERTSALTTEINGIAPTALSPTQRKDLAAQINAYADTLEGPEGEELALKLREVATKLAAGSLTGSDLTGALDRVAAIVNENQSVSTNATKLTGLIQDYAYTADVADPEREALAGKIDTLAKSLPEGAEKDKLTGDAQKIRAGLTGTDLKNVLAEVKSIASGLPTNTNAAAVVTAVDDVAPKELDATQQKGVGSSRVDLQACKLEYSIVSPK